MMLNSENLLVPFVVAICVLNTGLNGGLRPGFPIAVNPQQEITICYCIYTYMHIHAYIYTCVYVCIYICVYIYNIYIYMHIRIGNHTIFNIVG